MVLGKYNQQSMFWSFAANTQTRESNRMIFHSAKTCFKQSSNYQTQFFVSQPKVTLPKTNSEFTPENWCWMLGKGPPFRPWGPQGLRGELLRFMGPGTSFNLKPLGAPMTLGTTEELCDASAAKTLETTKRERSCRKDHRIEQPIKIPEKTWTAKFDPSTSRKGWI